MDSIPVVVLTGQVPTQLIGNDAFQEVDIVGITRPCTKHNYLVKSVDDLAECSRRLSTSPVPADPGRCLWTFRKDVLQATTLYKPIKEVNLKSYNPTYEPNVKQLPKVIELIKEASRRPVVFAGGGVILSKGLQGTDRVCARKIQAPVTSTLMGLGAFPAGDPLWLGMIGMHGTYRANMSTSDCDLDDRRGRPLRRPRHRQDRRLCAHAQIIHIDIDPTSIRKNIPVSVPLWATAGSPCRS
jgi:acetolactate synthase I/II/III large subunit